MQKSDRMLHLSTENRTEKFRCLLSEQLWRRSGPMEGGYMVVSGKEWNTICSWNRVTIAEGNIKEKKLLGRQNQFVVNL